MKKDTYDYLIAKCDNASSQAFLTYFVWHFAAKLFYCDCYYTVWQLLQSETWHWAFCICWVWFSISCFCSFSSFFRSSDSLSDFSAKKIMVSLILLRVFFSDLALRFLAPWLRSTLPCRLLHGCICSISRNIVTGLCHGSRDISFVGVYNQTNKR